MTKHPHTPRRPRRFVVAAAAAMLVGAGLLAPLATAPTATAADATIPGAGLVGEYLFTQTSGSTVPNSAAGAQVGAATVVNGTDAQWTGTSLVLAGGAKTSTTADWVRLPDSLLAGKQSATITIETKFDATMLTNWHFLWNIGNDATTQYYFTSVKDLARTSITATAGAGEINARAATALTADRWYSLTSVIDGSAGTISFYVDGVRVAQTATTLKPSSITAQTLNAIGRSPYPDSFYKGEVSSFRVYDRALSATEISDVSSVDARLHESTLRTAAQTVVDGFTALDLDDATTVLPTSSAASVTWTTSSPGLAVSADGKTLHADQPATGQPALTGTVTATASVRGITASRSLPVTVAPAPAPTSDYGYLMVHFIEDSAGYAEKIYLDVSRGDDPEQWDPLNGGKPILASQLGTTGIRDPYLTYNPETKTYYIIATDLRVFGGDSGSGSCTSWCYWTTKGSTRLVVWESTDLISWGEPRSIDVALDANGARAAELGMAWAPEATWVDDYYPDGRGAFVLYWSSNVYPTAEHTGTAYNQVLWGATTDFTQGTFAYGGSFVDAGANTIDTTLIQNGGTTYRITKDNSLGKGIYMESTTAPRWWESGTAWTQLQTGIGAAWAGGNAGGVEGPAVFKSHSEDRWYLYVDVIPSIGYKPMSTTNLDAGWTQLTDPSFFMTPSTKHGGVISLTRAQYDEIRSADAASATTPDLGSVEVAAGSTAAALASALPSTAPVSLAYDRGTASRPVAWNTSAVDLATPGTYPVAGVVQTIGANLNTWTGAGGSTAYNAPNRVLSSTTAISVSAHVVVAATAPTVTITPSVTTRCVAGKVVLTASVRNDSTVPLLIDVDTVAGAKSFAAVAPGKTVTAALTSRSATVPAGHVTVTAQGAVSGQTATTTATADYAARTCN